MKPVPDRDRPLLGDALWAVQPRWVKRLAVGVALPAWLVLAYGVFTSELSSSVTNIAIAVFAFVGIIELVFIARAFWRLDI